jgi:signal transduction histidine kinase
VFSVVPWVVGQALRRERNRTAELQKLAAELESQREQRARDAVAVERGRIARELHDIVGHAISLITVQADAAAKVVRRAPERAIEPLDAIQATSRGALTEMRQLVGLLRESDEETPWEPQPGIENVQQLIAEARRSGLPVTFELRGDPLPLPATLNLAAYRIVQEGLTNVRKHAKNAHTRVRVLYEPHELQIEVRNDGDKRSDATAAGGHGLVGIRERVALLGGTVDARPEPGGGFAVRARLPFPRTG